MNTSHLPAAPDRIYGKIFQHPLSHNLTWQEVHRLLPRIAQVVTQPNGSLAVTRGGETIVLPEPRTKDVVADDLMKLRHFLQRTEAAAAPAPEGGAPHLLLVINHHEARIFRTELTDAVPERILPAAPEDFFRHAHNSKDFTRGREKPDPNSFFAPIARALHEAGHILVFGSGKGMASEMEQFVDWLRVHHPELARRIAGTRVVDEHHLTEGQLLAFAREFYLPAPRHETTTGRT